MAWQKTLLERLRLWDIVAGFKTSYLVAILAGLFLLDLVVPDPFPLADEIVLGLSTLLLARWRGRANTESKPPPKNVTPRAKVER